MVVFKLAVVWHAISWRQFNTFFSKLDTVPLKHRLTPVKFEAVGMYSKHIYLGYKDLNLNEL